MGVRILIPDEPAVRILNPDEPAVRILIPRDSRFEAIRPGPNEPSDSREPEQRKQSTVRKKLIQAVILLNLLYAVLCFQESFVKVREGKWGFWRKFRCFFGRVIPFAIWASAWFLPKKARNSILV